jgi:predicted phosphatase
MNKAVALLNIEHFRKLLVDEANPVKRKMLFTLLAEEEAKLAAAAGPPTERIKES